MSDLVEFAKHVEDQLFRTKCEPHWERDEAERYMASVAERRIRFEDLAVQLNDTVIQPRLELLASYFPNANLTANQLVGHSVCWFGYCERFPSSTKVSFTVEHDVRLEKMAVCYEVSMMPVFIKFNEHDRLTMTLDEVNDILIVDWIEERLAEFLDAYLQIDRGGEDFEDVAVTDPVCGMRVSRSSAAASDAHDGHPYYFCSEECQKRFAREPTAFVQVKMM